MKLFGWVHLLDKSHIHISKSETEPPPVEGECALKAIYHDPLADKVIEGLIPAGSEQKDEK